MHFYIDGYFVRISLTIYRCFLFCNNPFAYGAGPIAQITKCQIFQFCCFCVQSIYVGYMNEGKCDFPPIISKSLLWYMFSLIALFMHFLITNKGKKKIKKVE